jgi:hypothetical protein
MVGGGGAWGVVDSKMLALFVYAEQLINVTIPQ